MAAEIAHQLDPFYHKVGVRRGRAFLAASCPKKALQAIWIPCFAGAKDMCDKLTRVSKDGLAVLRLSASLFRRLSEVVCMSYVPSVLITFIFLSTFKPDSGFLSRRPMPQDRAVLECLKEVRDSLVEHARRRHARQAELVRWKPTWVQADLCAGAFAAVVTCVSTKELARYCGAEELAKLGSSCRKFACEVPDIENVIERAVACCPYRSRCYLREDLLTLGVPLLAFLAAMEQPMRQADSRGMKWLAVCNALGGVAIVNTNGSASHAVQLPWARCFEHTLCWSQTGDYVAFAAAPKIVMAGQTPNRRPSMGLGNPGLVLVSVVHEDNELKPLMPAFIPLPDSFVPHY
eukprot:5208956-Amphidinium_carterae.1